MKPRGLLLWVIALAGVLAAIAVLRLYASLDARVEAAIERHGSELTGTRVRVGSVRIDVRQGTGVVRGLRIGNPEGFSSSDAFRFDEILLRIAVRTLAQEPVVIDEIALSAPAVDLELDAAGRSNVQAILDHVRSRRQATPESAEGAGQEGTAKAVRRLAVRRLGIGEGQLRADAEAVGAGSFETSLASFEMRDLGGAKGASPSVLGAEVLRAYGRRVVEVAAARQFRRGLDRVIDEKTGEAAEALKGLLDRVLD